MKTKKELAVLAISLMCALSMVGTAAAQYVSPHYQTNEVFFGNGGGPGFSSSNYQAQVSVGETGVGNSKSANYQANSGFNTSDAPLLEVNVNGGVFDLGLVDATSTKTASTTFTIRDYLSGGYSAQIDGTPPTNGYNGHTIAACSSPCLASPGTEQFGVNLVANTNPSVGANPVQTADVSGYPTFGFGTPTSNYGQPNRFTFNDGDIIASSPSSSGTTQYTLSIMMDVAAWTPAGVYGDLDGMYGGSLYVLVVASY